MKKPNPKANQSTTRRKVLKSFVVTAGSVTFIKSNEVLANTDALPPVINVLLDDENCRAELNVPMEVNPNEAGTEQIIQVPDCATEVDILVSGGGGAGSASAQGELGTIAGARGGAGVDDGLGF